MKKTKTHFRKNYRTNHPAYIYAYDPSVNEYLYIGITHAAITKGIKNIKIDNPNPKDAKDSFMRPYATHEKVKNFAKYQLNWKSSRKTGQIARKIKRNYKK